MMQAYNSLESEVRAIRNNQSVCFSDSEQSSKGNKVQSDAMKDYWFGKKYFECVLAQKTLEENATEEMLTVIDSKFEIALREFSYKEGINTLRTFGLQSPQSKPIDCKQTTHVAFLSLMGSIVRHGSESEQRAIKEAICGKESAKAFLQYSGYEPSSNIEHHDGNQDVTPNPHPVEPDMRDIAHYTMVLKERGDLLGVSPSYIEESNNVFPPTFKVTVRFQDITSVGLGRTKRQAKHEASKAACQILGLNL